MGPESKRRAPLTRAAVLAAAVALADRDGLDAVSMRNLAQELGVVPMALYKHVANKDELLDGMADAIVAEIDPPRADLGWKQALRGRIQSARDVMLRHRWASRVLATRTQPSPVVLAGLDAVIATLLAGGLSPGLIHQVMHTLGSRLWGFNVEVFPSPPPPADPAERERLLAQLGAVFPHVLVVAGAARHRQDAIVGDGCDDNAEFAFGIDLVLDGIERLHRAEAASPQPPG